MKDLWSPQEGGFLGKGAKVCRMSCQSIYFSDLQNSANLAILVRVVFLGKILGSESERKVERRGVILTTAPPHPPQNEPLKSPPYLGLNLKQEYSSKNCFFWPNLIKVRLYNFSDRNAGFTKL